MMKHWWKILGVLLLIYSFIIGMLIPLKPGIADVQPSNVKSGQMLNLKVTGYNTFYTQADGKLRAWLKMNDELSLSATQIKAISDNELSLQFQIPVVLPINQKVKEFVLVIDDPINGTSIMPNAVFITQANANTAPAENIWTTNLIENLHQKEGMTYPYRNILSETIRNTFYHIPFWFAMMIIFVISMVYSAMFLSSSNPDYDYKANAFTQVGILYGILGLITGAIWAKHTWGSYWSFDIKQNMAAISMLVYLAYYVLRSSFEDEEKKARISAVYNIFAFATLIPLLFVIPRLVDSLHPGNGGNPGFGGDDLDNTMRMILYPATIGWTLFGTWMANIIYRMQVLREKILES